MIQLILTFLLLLATPLFANGAEERDLDGIAAETTSRHSRVMSEQETRIEEIHTARNARLAEIKALKEAIATEETLLATDKSNLQILADKRDALQQDIATRLASKEELDHIVLDHIRNFLGLAEHSPVSHQLPKRLTTLHSYLQGGHVFDIEDMNTLMNMYFQDIGAGSKNVAYRGEILDRSGENIQADILTLGHMGALFETDSANGFLTFSSGSERLLMSGDPGFFNGRIIASYFAGEKNKAPIDLSGGSAISELSRKETLQDQLKSGGILVLPILLVGFAAIVLTLERLIFLGRVRYNTDALMQNVTELVLEGDFDTALETTRPHRNKPTGRVLMAGLIHRHENREIIESAISETILIQAPRLERFISTLKVLAAVAPLLGLLGTVTGMINTFQAITTHGTGDPRLMAGGISEAMVTTQVGLAVAIPILMIASFFGSRVKNLSRDMEEKGIALLGALLMHKTSPIKICERNLHRNGDT